MQEWTALAKMVFRLKPLQRNNPPTNKFRLTCYKCVHTKVSSQPVTNLDTTELLVVHSMTSVFQDAMASEATGIDAAKQACMFVC